MFRVFELHGSAALYESHPKRCPPRCARRFSAETAWVGRNRHNPKPPHQTQEPPWMDQHAGFGKQGTLLGVPLRASKVFGINGIHLGRCPYIPNPNNKPPNRNKQQALPGTFFAYSFMGSTYKSRVVTTNLQVNRVPGNPKP